MMRLRRQRSACSLLGALLFVVASVSAALAAEDVKRGGTAIVVIGADPAILNPNVTVGAPDVLTGCMLYDGLVRFAEGFQIVPSLAKSWARPISCPLSRRAPIAGRSAQPAMSIHWGPSFITF